MEHLSYDQSDGIAVVTLNRPEKKNALSLDLFEALAEQGEALKHDTSLRGVILTGAGTDFCAGIDLTALQTLLPKLDETRAKMLNPPSGQVANWFQKPCTVWAEIPVPVVAVLEGVCLGAGFQLALGADFRIVSPTLRMSIMESRWGLIPDMGISQSLPKLLRADQAKKLMMTAEMVDADAALDLGLVTEIAENPLATAREFLASLSQKSPDALAACKKLVDQTWTMAEGAGLAVEARLQAGLIGAPNQMEAVMAGLAKRSPKFN